MLYVKVHKEIREYEEKIFLGLTTRQLRWGGLAIACSAIFDILTVVILKLPQDVGIYGGGPIAFALFAIGWTDYEGIPIDDYIKIALRYHTVKQVVEYHNESFDDYGKENGNEKKQTRKQKRENKRIDENTNEWEG